METSELRSLVKAAAIGTPHAKLWPNGLGFDCRGVQYCTNDGSIWYASSNRQTSGPHKVGQGPTPQAAKAAAGIGGRSINSRGGQP
jgi:hypothetical protein